MYKNSNQINNDDWNQWTKNINNLEKSNQFKKTKLESIKRRNFVKVSLIHPVTRSILIVLVLRKLHKPKKLATHN